MSSNDIDTEFNSKYFYGNIINWNNATWLIDNMEWYNTSYLEVCLNYEPNEFLKLPGKWKLESGMNVCMQFKGQVNTITNKDNENQIISFINKDENCKRNGKIFQLKKNQIL